MSEVKSYTHGKATLKIFTDDNARTPRDWDNIGKMICIHSRYHLGDRHDYKGTDYRSWDEFKKAVERKENAAVILPLYLYDHSGITMSTKPFACRWDSMQVGFIVVSKETLRKEYNVKRITKAVIEKATKVLEGEVETYDQYLTGDVYGFKLFVDGEEKDSVWGFFGSDVKTNGILDYVDNAELVEYVKKT